MPIYNVKAPDGNIYAVKAPEGVTKDELYYALQSKLGESQRFFQPLALPETTETAPTDTSSDFLRGLKSYAPQTKEIIGGAEVLLGKSLGSKGLMQKGIETTQAAQLEQAPLSKETDSLANAWEKGIGTVITDWLPYQAGIGLANVGESLAASAIGAGAGLLSPVPGGAATGAISGFIGKQLVKKGIKDQVEKIAEKEGLKAAEEFTAKETIKFLETREGKKAVNKYIGMTAGLSAQAVTHGAGEVTSRAAEEAYANAKTPEDQLAAVEQLDTSRLLPAAALHSVADFISAKIGLGALDKLASPTRNFFLSVGKNIAVTGTKEVPPELMQSALERYGAELPLADREAIQEYIDTAGASYAMMAIPGGVGAARSHLGAKPTAVTSEEEKILKPGEVGEEDKQVADIVAPKGSVDSTEIKSIIGKTKDATLASALKDIFSTEEQKAKRKVKKEAADESIDTTATGEGDVISGKPRRKDTAGVEQPDGSGLAISGIDTKPIRVGEEKQYPSLKALQAQTIEEIPVTDYTFANKGQANKFVKENNLNDFKVIKQEDGQFNIQPKTVLKDIGFDSIAQALQDSKAVITNPSQVKNFINENFNPAQVEAIKEEAKINEDRLYKELFKFYKQSQQAPRQQELLSKLGEKAQRDTDAKFYSTLPAFFRTALKADKDEKTKKTVPNKTPIQHFEELRKENPNLSYDDLINVGIEVAAAEDEQLKHDLADTKAFNKVLREKARQKEVEDLVGEGMSQEEAAAKVADRVKKGNPKYSIENPYDFIESAEEYSNLYNSFLGKSLPAQYQQKEMDRRAEFVNSLTPQQKEIYDKRAEYYRDRNINSIRTRVEGEAREAANARLRGKTPAQSLKQKQKAQENADKKALKLLESTKKAEQRLAQQETTEQVEVRRDLDTKNKFNNGILRDISQKKSITQILKNLAGVYPIEGMKDYSYQHTAEYFAKLFDSLNAKGVKSDVKVVIGTVRNGRPGQFNPKTNTITIDPANAAANNVALGQVLVHETTHYALDHIVDNEAALSANQKVYLDRLKQNYEHIKNNLGDKFEIDNIKEFFSEITSNGAFGIEVGKLPSKNNPFIDTLKELAKNIAGALGFTKYAPTKPVFLQGVLNDIQNILTDADYTTPTEAMRGQGISYAPKEPKVVEKEKEPQTAEKIIDSFQDLPTEHRTTFGERIMNLFQGEKTSDAIHKTFVNSRYFLKKWQSLQDAAQRIKRFGDDFNNIYDLVATAFGRAQILKSSFVFEHEQKLYQALQAYADATGNDLNYAFKSLMGYRIATHEPERRTVKFLLTAPVTPQAADMRERILNIVTSEQVAALEENERKALMAQLRAKLDETVYNNLQESGISEEGYIKTDPNASEYNVIKGFNSNQVAMLRNKLENDPNKPLVDDIFKIMDDLNAVTIELNRQGNYWTNSTDAITEFYGWKNYSPFKVKPGEMSEKNRARFNIEGTRLGKEGRDYPGTFEGSERESENPVLQTLVEATLAVARAGRKDVTQAIKNAVDQGLIKGDSKYGDYTFTERFNNKVDDKKMRERNVIYHYNKDGSMSLIKIDDPNIVEAIRRTYNHDNQVLNLLNSVTSAIGQGHTRYNLPFAPMNFVRDVLTNTFVMAADMDLETAGKYAASASVDLAANVKNINSVVRAFNRNDITTIKNLAKADESGFINDMLEYLMYGGNVSVVEGLSAAGQLERLWRSSDKGKILHTKEQIDKFFDGWMGTFELSARTSAYRIVKKNLIQKYIERGVSQEEATKAATIEGVAYTKGLANFEEVGDWGRGMGAAFVFFRASAVGAARAIQSLAPAFRSWESVERYLPSDIKNNPEALANSKADYMRRKQSARIVAGGLMGVGIVAYTMSAMFAGDDEDDRNKTLTDDLSRWTRYARLSIGDDKVVQLPWGFGFGAFAAIGAQIAGATMSTGNSIPSIMGNIVNIGLDSFLPLPVSRISPFDNPSAWLMDSVTPSILRPVYEYTMNVNAFGQEIYNNRHSRYGDAYTGGDNIPDIYKDAAKNLYDLTGIDWSPNTMYFFANNYIDGASRLAQNGYGALLTMSGNKEFDPKRDLFLVESFISNRSNVDARQFSQLEKDILEKEKAINMLKSNPEKFADYLADHPEDPALVKAFNKQVSSQLNELRQAANQVRRDPAISRIDKAEMLKENKILQNKVKKNIFDLMDPLVD